MPMRLEIEKYRLRLNAKVSSPEVVLIFLEWPAISIYLITLPPDKTLKFPINFNTFRYYRFRISNCSTYIATIVTLHCIAGCAFSDSLSQPNMTLDVM
jgi:hypothetical protein